MFCTTCGSKTADADLFCARCGHSIGPSPAPPAPTPILSRPMDRNKLGGVCAGFARYFNMDVTLMRILWVVAIFLSGGLAIPLYIVAWILMPRDWPYPPPPTRRIVVC